MITLEGALYSIETMSWYASPIILMVLVIRRAVRTLIPARWQYYLWMLVVARLLVPIWILPHSAYSLQKPSDQAALNIEQSVALADLPSVSHTRLASSATSATSAEAVPATLPDFKIDARQRQLDWRPIASILWIVGVTTVLIIGFSAHLRLVLLIRRSRLVIPELIARQWVLSTRLLNRGKGPELWISGAVSSPVLMGVFRPKVVLPREAIHYSSNELEHIFAHELAHYRGLDYLTNLLHLFAVALHWFNPLVWVSLHGAQFDRECAADEWALSRLPRLGSRKGTAREYCETVLKLVERRSGLLTPVLGISESRSDMKQRLGRILTFKKSSIRHTIAGLLLLIVLAMPALSRNGLLASGSRGIIYDRNGVILADSDDKQIRIYPNGPLASHTLGFLSQREPGVYQGASGIEQAMEPYLHDTASGASDSIFLTLDSRIQRIVESSLAKCPFQRVAVVVMDPNNGDVLAIASLPSYDPNQFVLSNPADVWQRLKLDPQKPLMNRAIHAFPPGSSFKPLVALAGLKTGKVDANTEFDCPAFISVDDHLFHNSDSKDAGKMSLGHAIQVSSDVYFYQFAIKCGIGCIDDLGQLAGFGQQWNLIGGHDDDTGILPGPQWMAKQQAELRQRNPERTPTEHWSDGQTANTSIGQGHVLATPLQMTAFYCAIANGGTVYVPRLYDRVTDSTGKELHDSFLDSMTKKAQVFHTLDVKPSDLKAVQNSLLAAVNDGTGQLAQIPGVAVCGKTGTAQAREGDTRDLKCWFCCYAPAEKPRYVVTVLCEGATWGGTSSAPLAKEILQQLLVQQGR